MPQISAAWRRKEASASEIATESLLLQKQEDEE
jgi:hypothetical protein